MNKQLGILAIIIILVVGVYAFSKKDVQNSAHGTMTAQPVVVEPVVVTPVVSADLSSSGTYTVDSSASTLAWQGKKTVLTEWIDEGTIGVKEGSVVLEKGMITQAHLVIDMSTIAATKTGKGAGFEMLAKHLSSPDFFDVTKYPTSRFEMTKATKTAHPHEYLIEGNLTIKDKTVPTTITAQVSEETGVVKALGTVSLDRTAWDVKFGSGKFFQNLGDKAINDVFTVTFALTAKK